MCETARAREVIPHEAHVQAGEGEARLESTLGMPLSDFSTQIFARAIAPVSAARGAADIRSTPAARSRP